MNGLDILGVVISPSPSHAFGLDMVGHNLAVIDKRLVTDCASSALVSDLPIQQLPHLCRRSEFPISPLVVWVFDVLNTKLKSAFFSGLLAPAAEQRSVERAVFIPTESHGNLQCEFH
jgi:hypothetical protein